MQSVRDKTQINKANHINTTPNKIPKDWKIAKLQSRKNISSI